MTDQQKPWGDNENFDADKAWTLIQNLRAERDQAKADRTAALTERDALARERDALNGRVAEFEADVQAKADALASKDREIADALTLRAKENLLIDAGLPRSLAPSVVGDDEAAWQNTVQQFAQLRGDVRQERTPDPAQAANTTTPSEDAAAKAFFGL